MGFLRRLFGRDIETDTAVQNGYALVADSTKTSGIDWSDVLVRGGLGRDLADGINYSADIDATVAPGKYSFDGSTTGDTPGTAGNFEVRERDTTIFQVAHTDDNKLLSRRYSAGWGPWVDYSSNVSPSVTYIEGSDAPGDPDVTSTVSVRGTIRIIVTTGGGGGGGGGGANAGAGPFYDGWPGTGGGAGVKAVLEYCSDSIDAYDVDIVIAAAADGGMGGIGDGGFPGENQQPGDDGEVGASVTITIKGSNPITLEGGRPGKGGYQFDAGISGSRTVQGSGVGTSLVSCLGNYLEIGASITLNSGTLTVTYISTGGSQSIAFDPSTGAPLAGGEGVSPATLGYDRDWIAGGAAGTPFVNGGDGSYPTLQSQVGYGGGGGGAGASGNGGTAGGKGGKGSKGCVTVYSYV